MRLADPAVFAAVAAGVFLAARASGSFEVESWAPFGIVLVAAVGILFGAGRRIPLPVAGAGAALVLVGGVSLASTAWGGLPSEAWKTFDQFALAAAALVLGGLLTSKRGRRALVLSAVVAGITAHAVELLLRLALPAHPDLWIDGRLIQGPVGYHNAQGALFALAVPLALWQADHRRLPVRVLGGASAALLVGALLLTQSRGALLALAFGVAVQLAWARRLRLVLVAALVAAAGAGLWLALRAVDAALVDASAGERVEALRRYGGWTVLAAVVVGGLAALVPPAAVTRAVAAVLAALLIAGGVGAAARGGGLDLYELTVSGLASDADPNLAPAGETRIVSLSRNGRKDAWRVARAMSAEKPLTGHGQGRFASEWGAERRLTNLYILQPHSLELELLSELGLIGLGAFAAFCAFAGRALVRTSRRALAAAAAGAAVVLLVEASVDWTWSFPGVVAPALLAVGAAAGSRPQRELGWRGSVALAVIASALFVSFAGPYLADRRLERATTLETVDPTRSRTEAESARKLDPWNPSTLSLEGRLAEARGDLALAADRYRAAASVSQRPWLDLYDEASVHTRAGAPAKARALCVRAVQANPGEDLLVSGPCIYGVAGNSWPVVPAVVSQPGRSPAFDAYLVDQACAGCSLGFFESELVATIAGGADPLDTAYARLDLGGRTGLAGRVAVRDRVRIPRLTPLTGNLAVLQVRDVRNELVWEIYVSDKDRTIRLFSPEGGLRAREINESTGVVARRKGPRAIEVSALADESVIVRVDGVERLVLDDLEGATTGNQRFLRVGATGYTGWSVHDSVRVHHGEIRAGRSA